YAELIQHHIRRQDASQFPAAVVGTEDLLPPVVQALAEPFVDGWLDRFSDADFWRADCAAVFDAIVSDARATLTAAGVFPHDDALFNLFQLITLCFAGAAAERPQLRRSMGIRKGLFRR